MKILTKFVLLSIVFVIGLSANTYYVSPSGADSNPGSFERPWASPGYGSKHMGSGDTLIILPGEYILSVYYDDMITPPSGTSENWTIVKGEGPVKPILKGRGDSGLGLLAAIDISGMSYIKIQNIEITSYIDSPYSGGLREGIEAGGSSELDVSDIVLEDLVIHHIEETAINASGDTRNVVIRRCNFHHTGGSIISAPSGRHDGWTNVVIDSCYLGYAGHFYEGREQISPWERPDGFGIERSRGPIEIKNTLSEFNMGDGIDSKSERTYIHNCIVANNWGDGVKLWGDSSRVENTLIYGVGGGDPAPSPWVSLVVDCDKPNSFFEFTNVTVHDGSPSWRYLATIDYDTPTLPVRVRMRNCIFQSTGSRFYCAPGVSLEAKNNLFFITGEEIQLECGGREYDSLSILTFGTNNRYGNPGFLRPSWGEVGDYHLAPSSPAINAGIEEPDIPPYDLEYFPRPFGTAYDIGCYEFHSATNVESRSSPGVLLELNNFPNPFNTGTTITFSLPQRTRAKLKIFDILGREVKTLADAELDCGVHNFFFLDEALPGGIYFCRLETRNLSLTKRLILIK